MCFIPLLSKQIFNLDLLTKLKNFSRFWIDQNPISCSFYAHFGIYWIGSEWNIQQNYWLDSTFIYMKCSFAVFWIHCVLKPWYGHNFPQCAMSSKCIEKRKEKTSLYIEVRRVSAQLIVYKTLLVKYLDGTITSGWKEMDNKNFHVYCVKLSHAQHVWQLAFPFRYHCRWVNMSIL